MKDAEVTISTTKHSSPEELLTSLRTHLRLTDDAAVLFHLEGEDTEIRRPLSDLALPWYQENDGDLRILLYLHLEPAPPAKPIGDGAGFIDLPAELRNEIYTLHMADYPRYDTLKICEIKEAPDFGYPITRASRQIRDEVVPMLYHQVAIDLDIPDPYGFNVSKDWLALMHPEAVKQAAKFLILAGGGLVECLCAAPCTMKVSVDVVKGEVEIEAMRKGKESKTSCLCARAKKVKRTAKQVMRGVAGEEKGTVTKERLSALLDAVAGED